MKGSGKRLLFRRDSRLGKLPPERQEEIAGWIESCKTGDCFEFARKKLHKAGLNITRTPIQNWYEIWSLRQELSSAEVFSEEVKQLLRKNDPSLKPEVLEQVGQLVFTKIALKARDAKTFAILSNLRLAREKAKSDAKFEKQKLRLLKRREDREDRKFSFKFESGVSTASDGMLAGANRQKADEINARNDLTRAEKIAAMRKAAFADVDEYLKSGKLLLPS